MTLTMLILLIVCFYMHFMTDFFFQDDAMALNKSKHFGWLSLHCFVYSFPFWIINWRLGLITLISHIIIDGITSRITSYLWKKEERHWFFVTIGFDQFLHNVVLLLTIYVFQTQILSLKLY